MLVEYLSPWIALLLTWFFSTNSAFTFADPFRAAGTVAGGTAFVNALQSKLLLNFAAQVGPEIIADYFCIMVERYYWLGPLMDEYWAKAVSLEGFTQFLPAVTLAMMLNVCVVLATGRSSCAAGECVQGL